MIDPLVAIRFVQFAATILIAGAAAFSVLVLDPIWQRSDRRLPSALISQTEMQISRLIWIGLTACLASGAAWLAQVSANIAEEPWLEAIGDGTAWAVLTGTQFGFVSVIRLLFAAMVALLLLLPGPRDTLRTMTAMVAALLLGALAWMGHAAAAPGLTGHVHLASDVVHLLAAGTWIGGLLPLFLVLLSSSPGNEDLAAATIVLRRFSALGLLAVTALFASGFINAWFLTDRLHGLFGTDYGRLLQIKIVLFIAMASVAAVNRLLLLPRLSKADDGAGKMRGQKTLTMLVSNVAIEITLGVAVIAVVAVLGMTPPAGHNH